MRAMYVSRKDPIECFVCCAGKAEMGVLMERIGCYSSGST